MKILLLGTHGQHNAGDNWLLDTFLTQLGAEHTYFVNSYTPKETEALYRNKFNLHSFHTTKDKVTLVKYILRADLVFFAGGTILRELYRGSGRHKLGSLLMVWSLTQFSRYIARKKIIMSNIGVGPINTRSGRFLARLALNSCMRVSFRDKQSHEVALACGLSPAIRASVVPDCIFIKEFQGESTHSRAESDSPVIIGLNLVHDIADPSLRNSYKDKIASGLMHIQSTLNTKIQPIPMQTGFNPHTDIEELDTFLKNIDVLEYKMPLSDDEIITAIEQCSMMVASRYHSIVLSAILGIPVIPLIYDVKVQSLLSRLGILHYGIEINKPMQHGEFETKFMELFENREVVAQDLMQRSRAMKDELQEYFSEIRATLRTVA